MNAKLNTMVSFLSIRPPREKLAKIKKHLLVLFMKEPVEYYKTVKRAHFLGTKDKDVQVLAKFEQRARVCKTKIDKR